MAKAKQKAPTRVASKRRNAPASVSEHDERNPGIELDLDCIESLRVNRSAIERRCAALSGRRTVKKDWQIGWLLRAITLMDLTTLAGDDTDTNVERLVAKAAAPLRPDLAAALGLSTREVHTAAVCVYHSLVRTAAKAVAKSQQPIAIAAVSTGFPAGLTPLATRLEEIRRSVRDGATEIDIVIHRGLVLGGEWKKLYNEVRAMREACGDAHMKSILATGELSTLRNVAQASWVCMMAGSDFIKTSTGKESSNATLPVSLVMARTIREYQERTGVKVGFKPAGGIRTAKQSLDWMILMKEELGDDWLEPSLFRFGASALLADIERQLEFHVTGAYSAYDRHASA